MERGCMENFLIFLSFLFLTKVVFVNLGFSGTMGMDCMTGSIFNFIDHAESNQRQIRTEEFSVLYKVRKKTWKKGLNNESGNYHENGEIDWNFSMKCHDNEEIFEWRRN